MNRRAFLMSAAGLAASPGASPPPPLPGEAVLPASASDLTAWLASFTARAIAAGVREDVVAQALDGFKPDPNVLHRDQNQPEFTRPIGDYIERVVSPGDISMGQARRQSLAPVLDRVEAESGVPAEILIAVWGIESSFGRITGEMDVVRSLATLAVAGRRKELAEQELIAALRILDLGLATRSQLKGSWAGAMGQTQFLPTDYLTYAVDGDGDGRRDIWGSSADALASTAQFLKVKAHWRPHESWALEAALPDGFDYGLADTGRRPVLDWAAMGVGLADGAVFAPADTEEDAQLLLPAGWRGPAFLAFPNHMAIRAYNNSTAYALAVGLLADRIAGHGPLKTPWPRDPPLGIADRIAAQQALAAMGYDPGTPDGVIGLKTRKALKVWQTERGLPADGYLTQELIETLKVEAGLSAVAPPAVSPPANGVSAG